MIEPAEELEEADAQGDRDRDQQDRAPTPLPARQRWRRGSGREDALLEGHVSAQRFLL
jgi:hypothetical protein